MSVESTCIFCGASDKFRCKSQETANKCNSFISNAPTPQKLAIDTPPEIILMKDIDFGRVIVKTHQDGIIDQLSVTIETQAQEKPPVNFILYPNDVDILLSMLSMAQKYSKQGTL